MAKKAVKKETVASPKKIEAFDEIDKIINKEFNDVVDISKIDTKIKTWYDWGVYSLNYICSKNLFGGIPSGRVIGIDGLSGAGKSLMCASAMKDPKLDYVIIVETEGGGHSQELMEFAGVDTKKVRIMKANTFTSYKVNKTTQKIEEIHDNALPANKANWETDKIRYVEGATSKIRRFVYSIQFNKINKNILIILDSLGNIQSVRGLSGTPDMGKRGQDFTNFFKNFDNEFEKSNMTFIFTNKMYQNVGNQYDPWKSTGGESPIYNSSLYLRLSTTAETDDVSAADISSEKDRRKSALGSSLKTIKGVVRKSRFGTEWRNIPFLLDFAVGPVKFSGLFTLLRDFGVINKCGGAWYEAPGLFEEKFYKKNFIKMFLENEKGNLEKTQKLLEEAEIRIKEERQGIQVNDIEEVIEAEETDDGDNPFGTVDVDELKKGMIRDVE